MSKSIIREFGSEVGQIEPGRIRRQCDKLAEKNPEMSIFFKEFRDLMDGFAATAFVFQDLGVITTKSCIPRDRENLIMETRERGHTPTPLKTNSYFGIIKE